MIDDGIGAPPVDGVVTLARGADSDLRRTAVATMTAVAHDDGDDRDEGDAGRWRYPGLVPTYEFLCRDCGTHFDVQRPMSASADPATCPDGHVDTMKLLSILAVAGRSAGPASSVAAAPASGGGCCGGACGCGG